MSAPKPDRYELLLNHLDLAGATGVDDAKWEVFQLRHLLDTSTLRIEVKSRQIAWSWLTAAEAVADALLDDRDSVFVSINQSEAAEKIRYARRVYEYLRMAGLPRIVRDNRMELEFANGARLSSLPGRPPRGRARANVYLDEFAHVRMDREIYQAALPITSKSGRIRIGSSPFGASGTFWEIQSQSMRRYPGYSRVSTPWWCVQAFCTDVAAALRQAPGMTTQERVERFGRDRIRLIYENIPLEDFWQEYECLFVDESTAWITWDEIRTNQQPDLLCPMVEVSPGNLGPAFDAIEQLARDAQYGQVEMALAAGVDVGRTRNTSELYIVGLSATGDRPLRLGISMERLPYDDQFDIMVLALRRLPLVGMWIDRNGIGNNLAENLGNQWPGLAVGQDFTNESKKLWATNIKMLMQQSRASLPVDRDLAYQIHSIKRIISPSKNLIFDTARNEKHHADKFWAWALALAASGQDANALTDDEIARAFGWQQTP